MIKELLRNEIFQLNPAIIYLRIYKFTAGYLMTVRPLFTDSELLAKVALAGDFGNSGSSPILVVFHDKSGCYSLRNNESYQTDFLINRV
jgi:hypothetical protein